MDARGGPATSRVVAGVGRADACRRRKRVPVRTRALEIDPLDQALVLEIRAEKFRDGRLVAAEEHTLSMRMYFPTELALLLERCGFEVVEVLGDHNDAPPTGDDEFLVYIARA